MTLFYLVRIGLSQLFWVRGDFKTEVTYSIDIKFVYDIINMIYEKIQSHFSLSCLLSCLTLLWWRSLSHRNKSINLLCKSMDWFLHDRDICHERINSSMSSTSSVLKTVNTCFILKINWQIFIWWEDPG